MTASEREILGLSWAKWRIVIFTGLLGALATLGLSINAADNRAVLSDPVNAYLWPADNAYLVRFTTTTSAANTAVCVVSSHTATAMVFPSSVTWSPVLTSTTTDTKGGRAYLTLQVVRAASNVSVDFDTVNLSTTTSPYLTQGQWWSPDDPAVHQGPICLMSPSTFTVTGWFWNHRPR